MTNKNIIRATGSATRQTLDPQGNEIPQEIPDKMTLAAIIVNHSKAVGTFSVAKARKTLAKPHKTQNEAEQQRLR